jgi:hypothetical protein
MKEAYLVFISLKINDLLTKIVENLKIQGNIKSKIVIG